jgi:hypothetical protein
MRRFLPQIHGKGKGAIRKFRSRWFARSGRLVPHSVVAHGLFPACAQWWQ